MTDYEFKKFTVSEVKKIPDELKEGFIKNLSKEEK